MKNQQKDRGYWQKFILPYATGYVFLIFLLVLVWGTVLWEVENDKQATEQNTIADNAKLALAFENHTIQAVLRVDQTLRFLKADFEANDRITSSVQLLIKQQIGDPLINQSILTNEYGIPRSSALTGRNSLFNAPRFQAHLKTDTGRPFIGPPRKGIYSDKLSVHISRRINHPDGSFAGMVSVALAADYFTGFYRAMELGTGQSVILVGVDGAVRASQLQGDFEKETLTQLFASSAKDPAGNFKTSGHNEVGPYYYSYRVLKDYPLIVQVGMSDEQAFFEFRQRRVGYFTGATAVSVLLFLYTALLARRQRKQRSVEERYRALTIQSHDAIALFDLETMEIVEANPRFEEMTGYSLSAPKRLTLFELTDDSEGNVLRNLDQLHATGTLPPTIRNIRIKSGRPTHVERTGSLVTVGGRRYELMTLRDVTAEMERQWELKQDLFLATQVQRALLPTIPRSEYFQIATMFRPYGFVSGDVYHLEWQENKLLLRGFLVDITGHGLATALQTAAVNVLLHEVMSLPEVLSVAEQLVWLNRRISQYIDETSFAAALAFELDFAASEIRYASAGITDFLFNHERISAPGMFLGISEKEEYEMQKLSFSPGDSVCFLTDGISDVLTADQAWGKVDAKNICALFDDTENSDKLKDDATVICITMRELAREKIVEG